MDTDSRSEKINDHSGQVIGCAFRVANTLGYGFLEKVYENALLLELRKAGLQATQQQSIQVRYDGEVVGNFTVDLIVEGQLLVELKATRCLDDIHMAQCLNYLRATELPLCLLLNFGNPRLEIKRIAAPRQST